jgi:hypothetical protein
MKEKNDSQKEPITTILDTTASDGCKVALLKTTGKQVHETMEAVFRNLPKPVINQFVGLQVRFGPLQQHQNISSPEALVESITDFPENDWSKERVEAYFNLLMFATECVAIIAVLNAMLIDASRNPDPDPEVRAKDAAEKHIKHLENLMLEKMMKNFDIKEGEAR